MTPLDPQACRALWRAVLSENLRIAAGNLVGGASAGARRRDRNDARSWITSRDFEMVCDLAGVEPSRVRDAYKRGVFNPGVWRKERGTAA